MTEATQELGAQDSVEDRIAAILDVPAEDTQETETTEVTSEEVETEEVAETEEVEAQEETEDETEEVDAEEITLEADELAAYLGVDSDAIVVDDEGNLRLKTKIDGEEGSATLAELLKGYQLEGHVTKKSMELSDQRKAFEAERAKVQTELGQRLQQTEALIQTAQAELLNEFQSIDWQALETQDPGTAALYKQKYQERFNSIEQAKNQALTQKQQINQAAIQERLQREAVALVDKLPAWADAETATREKGEVAKYLTTQGFTPEQVSQTSDHRAVLIARKAMLYDKLMAEQDTKQTAAKKKVKKLPKVMKPGASKSKGQKQAEAQKAKIQKLRRNGGKVDDVAALLLDRM